MSLVTGVLRRFFEWLQPDDEASAALAECLDNTSKERKAEGDLLHSSQRGTPR